jgi:hypothetical protein
MALFLLKKYCFHFIDEIFDPSKALFFLKATTRRRLLKQVAFSRCWRDRKKIALDGYPRKFHNFVQTTLFQSFYRRLHSVPFMKFILSFLLSTSYLLFFTGCSQWADLPSSQIRKQITFEISYAASVNTAENYYYISLNTAGKAPTVPAPSSYMYTPTETVSLDYTKETYLADWTDYVLVHGSAVKLVKGPFNSSTTPTVQSQSPELVLGTKSIKVAFYVDQLSNTNPSTLNFDFVSVKTDVVYDKLDATYSTNMGQGTMTIISNEKSDELVSGYESLEITGGTVTVQ